MSRQQLLDLLYERFSHFISQDRYISMEEALNYILVQLEREKVLKLVADTKAKGGS